MTKKKSKKTTGRTKTKSPNHDNNGKFAKGNNANPLGRNAKHSPEFIAACKELAEEGLLRIRKIMEGPDDYMFLKAWEKLAAYGFGKPRQQVVLQGDEKQPFQIVVSRAITEEQFQKQLPDIVVNE